MNPKDNKNDQWEFEQVELQIQDENQQQELKTNQGTWTLQQNKKFVFFVTYFKEIFISKQRRKSSRIFKIFSVFLQSRNARQCRSHFQKLINKHKTIHRLKTHFKGLLGRQIYDQQFKKFSTMINTNHSLSNITKKQDSFGIKDINQIGVQTEESILTNVQQNIWINQNNLQGIPQQQVSGLYGLFIIPAIQYIPNTQNQQ